MAAEEGAASFHRSSWCAGRLWRGEVIGDPGPLRTQSGSSPSPAVRTNVFERAVL